MSQGIRQITEQMAAQAGFDVDLGEITAPYGTITGDPMDVRALLEKFAALVADNCALTVEVMFSGQSCPTRDEMEAAAKNVADGIRQRYGAAS
jgi:hypothetical protein